LPFFQPGFRFKGIKEDSMAISTIGADTDPFAPTPGPAPEDTRAPANQVEAAEPAPAPLPEGTGTKIDTTA
jgi:hypothetical protein